MYVIDYINGKEYYYLDDNGQSHGPFSEEQMCIWKYFGFFNSELKIREKKDIQFHKLKGFHENRLFDYSNFLQKMKDNKTYYNKIMNYIDITNPTSFPKNLIIPDRIKHEMQKIADVKPINNNNNNINLDLDKKLVKSVVKSVSKNVKPKISDNTKLNKENNDKKIEDTTNNNREVDEFGFGKWETVNENEFHESNIKHNLNIEYQANPKQFIRKRQKTLQNNDNKRIKLMSKEEINDSDDDRNYDDDYNLKSIVNLYENENNLNIEHNDNIEDEDLSINKTQKNVFEIKIKTKAIKQEHKDDVNEKMDMERIKEIIKQEKQKKIEEEKEKQQEIINAIQNKKQNDNEINIDIVFKKKRNKKKRKLVVN